MKGKHMNMKWKGLLAGVCMAVMAATAAGAATITTTDGVLSVETPTDSWIQTTDPNHWFVISDGSNAISVDHLSNGESLPAVTVADANYGAVYQAFVSTTNEVFVVKGLAKTQNDLPSLMTIIGTIKVLKYDTKTAIQKAGDTAGASDFAIREINADYYSTADDVNVRNGYSLDDSIIGTLSYGQKVTVVGSVTKGGADYGWYQIRYNTGTGYVSSGYLSPNAPASASSGSSASSSGSSSASSGSSGSSSGSGKYALASGFGVYDKNGNYQGLLVPYSDGYLYSNDMMAYVDNGDGSYSGAGEVLYSYTYNESDGSWNDSSSAYSGGSQPVEEGFSVYDDNGNYQGTLVLNSDGYYYSNDDMAYTDNGDGSYSGADETLYAYTGL